MFPRDDSFPLKSWLLLIAARLDTICLVAPRYKAKCVKTRCLQEWVGHLEPKFQGQGVVPGELDTFCYPTVQYRRVTDRQTDGQTELP